METETEKINLCTQSNSILYCNTLGAEFRPLILTKSSYQLRSENCLFLSRCHVVFFKEKFMSQEETKIFNEI